MILKVRFFSELDIQTRVNWINDQKINQNMSFDVPATYEKTLSWFKNNINNTQRVDFTFENQKNEIVAMGGLSPIDQKNCNGEYYLMINPDMLGRGIGTRASKWICNYGFIVLQLNKIYSYTSEHNVASCKMQENIGLKLEGVLRQQKYSEGKFQNRHFYGLLRNEWEGLNWHTETIEYEF